MAAASSKTGRAVRGMVRGLAATVIIAALYHTQVFAPAEWAALDLRFSRLPTLPARGEILYLDLDDNAIEQIGRWPWPRRTLALLIETLNECGARLVALDILLNDPQTPRYVKEGETDLYLDDPSILLNPDAQPVPILDDVELAEAIARSPNLFLGVSLDLAATGPTEQHALERRLWALLEDQPDISRREAARRLLGQPDPRTDAGDRLRREYLRLRAMRAVGRFTLPVEAFAALSLPPGRSPLPPLVTFAQAADHGGSVAYRPGGGGVRQVPLAVKTDQGILPQLALALAIEALAQDNQGIRQVSSAPGWLVLSCGNGLTRSIPVDANGFMLINWTRHGDPRWGGRHISAVAAADVWRAREIRRRNRNAYYLACDELAELVAYEFRQRPLPELFEAVQKNWKALQDARREHYATTLFDPARVGKLAKKLDLPGLVRREAELDAQLERGCRELIAFIDEQLDAADQAAGEADETEKRVRFLRALLRQIEAEDPRIRKRLAQAKHRLRQEVAGKIVLFGSVSTGAADFVPTAVDERTPGVVVHGQMLNTILSGKFVHRSGPWLSVFVVLAAGALVTVVTATRGPVQSSVLLVLAVLGYVGLGVAVWVTWTYWIVTVAPIAAMLAAFGVVTAYRQLTEQRQKRQITKVFKQYLSPAMVDRLVEDPALAGLGGQRRPLSCLFSDLAGFTSLSERLGPEGTVNVLNRYLDRVGEIIQARWGGTLSKFEGDGVVAFFGAPIAQDNHATRALGAALDHQEFLPEFNDQMTAEGLLPERAGLSVRVGVTTGEVLVGNMGSTQRIAYTAIGDSVNLAARLETANKFFGTRILVNEPAWRAGAAGVGGRPLGTITVVGRTQPVCVWEPLARAEATDEDLRRLIEDFTRGVDRYAAGDFEAARESFLSILGRTEDAAARAYLRLCGQAIAKPPDATDFDGIIHLTEK